MTHLTDEIVSRLPIAEGRAELLEELVASPDSDGTIVRLARRPRPARRWVAAVGAAAAVGACAVGVPLALQSHDHGAGRAPIASGPATDEAAVLAYWPAPKGWHVDATEDQGSKGGSITYVTGKPRRHVHQEGPGTPRAISTTQTNVEIDWYPARQFKAYAADRASEKSFGDLQVLGSTGHAITYSRTDHAVMRPPVGGFFLEVRAQGVDAAAFKRIVGELRGTDAEGLQATLPDTFVTDGDRPAKIAEIAKDIPLPAGFSLSQIHSRQTDPYQLGAEVTGAITCAWVDAWQSGDRKAAADAMATSHHWAVLKQMERSGDWPAAIWDLADSLPHSTPAQVAEKAGGIC